MRNVLVHYYLFKNAGGSIDRCLKGSFSDSWHAFDPEGQSGLNTVKEFDEIILEKEDTVAFSSHCIVPSILDRVSKLHSIIVLREPTSQVMSAYLIEWNKQMNLDEVYAGLDEYIYEKFSMPWMNANENFQTMRFAVKDETCRRPPGEASDTQLRDDTCNLIEQFPAFGLVEKFKESIAWIQGKHRGISRNLTYWFTSNFIPQKNLIEYFPGINLNYSILRESMNQLKLMGSE